MSVILCVTNEIQNWGFFLERDFVGVTITEIARLAGVSHSSVSRVLNGAQIRISDKRREQILKIARELNYVPNKAAKALKTGRHGFIAVIAYDITDAFAVECVSSLEKHLASTPYRALWMSCAHAGKNKIEPENLLKEVGHSVDGIIIIHAHSYLTDTAILKFWSETQKPIVTIIRSVAGEIIPSVTIDNQRGTRLLLDHLVKMGHRRVAFCYPRENDPSAEQRYLEFKALLKNKYDFPLDDNLYISVGGDVQDGYDAGKALLKVKDRPTAIIGYKDLTSIGLLNACYDQGVSVPKDISIASYDNIRMSEIINPALTTIAPCYDDIATSAMMKLDGQIDQNLKSKNRQLHYKVKPKLIVRNSTGKAR